MSDLTDRLARAFEQGRNNREILYPDITEALLDDVARLEAELSQANDLLREGAYTSYCWGYEKGHNDTVESSYTPPSEYPEEFQDIYDDLLGHLAFLTCMTPPAKPNPRR